MICSKCEKFVYAFYTINGANLCTDCYNQLHITTTVNHHIVEFLDYYCKLSTPEYAVMISGEWGCGKTWFMKGIMNRWHSSGIRYIYVSVYGITDFDGIESAIFEALHPWLASKSVALAAKILGGAVKGALQVDLNADGKKDINLQAQVPDISLPKYLTNTENYILIFDDIERCLIEPAALFGYINHFVEHQGYKSVLICNEKDILKKEKEKEPQSDKSAFIAIKEKLVGKTFSCAPDIDTALAHFIETVDDNNAKQVLKNNVDVILDVYKNAGYNNLRHLKQGFFEFARFYQFLPDFSISNSEFIKDILRLFMMFAIEIKAGVTISEEIMKCKRSFYKSLGNNRGDEADLTSVFSKYKNVSFFDTIISESLWLEFFERSLVDKKKLIESIQFSSYFKSQALPNWAKLWHWRDLETGEFDNLVQSVEAELGTKQYTTIGVVKHAVGLLSQFSSMGLVDRNIKDIIVLGQQHVLHLKAETVISPEISSFKNQFAYGLQFFGLDIPEFKDFLAFCDITEAESRTEAIESVGKSIGERIMADPRLFARSICVCNSEDQVYCDIPIFAHSDAEVFGKAYFSLPIKDKDLINSGINKRYNFGPARETLRSEEQWLLNLKDFFQRFTSEQDKLTRVRVRELVESIDAALVWLNQNNSAS